MRPLTLLVVLLPVASAFITYTFVSSHSDALSLDATQAAIVCLALAKMLLLGSTGVFPIDLDDVFHRVWGANRKKRDASGVMERQELPNVDTMPCVRRLLCEVETAARTSDSYLPQPSKNMEDRHPEEEVDVDIPDPLTELYVEAIRAVYGLDDPTKPDGTDKTDAALKAVKSLTGENCERAYKLCPGRYSAPMVFKAVFDEIGYKVHEEL